MAGALQVPLGVAHPFARRAVGGAQHLHRPHRRRLGQAAEALQRRGRGGAEHQHQQAAIGPAQQVVDPCPCRPASKATFCTDWPPLRSQALERV